MLIDPIKTVFLDRDGVINKKMPDGDYVKTWDEFSFLPGAKDALRMLKSAGYRIIVVTNQRGIARGLMTERDLQVIHERMQQELILAGAPLDGIYYCPHDEGQCSCRKPQIGLFLQAKREFPLIEFSNSYMIGDSFSDLEVGARLGCRNILVAKPSCFDIIEKAYARGIRIEGVASTLFVAVVQYVVNIDNSSVKF